MFLVPVNEMYRTLVALMGLLTLFLGGLSLHLGHFLSDVFGQIWTQGTLRYVLGPILVIFEICHFLTIPGPFEYFSENGCFQEIAFYSETDGPHDIQI